MGSKVSSKMAAPAARVIQAIRPRAPLIKFPDRLGVAKPNASEAIQVLAVNMAQQSPPNSMSVGTTPPYRPAVPFTRLPGSPDTLASIKLVPQRYRRRPMVVEEMEYIQNRGVGVGKRRNLRKDPRRLRESLNSHVEKRRRESQNRREDVRQKKLDFLRVIEEPLPLRRSSSYPFPLPDMSGQLLGGVSEMMI
uniref:Uncharacterized protein n=1 Tax=Gadus morhua TaxID=8049 RepID=A0A8C5C101_GADMO